VPQAQFRTASPGYFAAAGIAILEGREFSDDDGPEARPVAIVSRTMAERSWPGASAVGKHLRIADPPDAPVLEVVGVVADVKQYRLEGMATADLYLPLRQMPPSAVAAMAARMYWVVGTRGDDRRIALAMRQEAREVDPEVPASSTRTLAEIVSASLAPRRINARLLELFGIIALLLSSLGVYGVTAFSVAARRRELALRAAFGATRQALVRLVLRQELRPVLLGLLGGLAAALGVARLITDALFETSPADPLIYLTAGGALLAVATLACYVPARRASETDPARLLRA
jgi:predicted lysophospholipase L1 biosynthesis ABC-type transport system permease subunit